jgi:hypothetical protein
MGKQKERALELSELARSILIHTGVATYCDDHNYLKREDDRRAEDFAFALGANIIRRKQLRCDPADLNKAITAELDCLHDHCPDCPDC